MSKLKDILNKMAGKTIRSTQATVGAMGGNATVIAKCIKYDKHRKLCTIYDPIGKEPQQRFRGDDGDMKKYETLQGGRTVKVPWQPVDSGEDRESPEQALEEFHMLGVRDLDDVEPEQLYDYIEMLTAFQKINKGTSRFLRMIVDQRKFINGSGGGINKHWVQQIIIEVQYDMEGWPDTARATRIIESCPIPAQKPTANSIPPGDPMPCTMTPDGQMFFDKIRFASEADWLLGALGSFQRPSQASDSPISTTGEGEESDPASEIAGSGFNGNIPIGMLSTPDSPLITAIGSPGTFSADFPETGVVQSDSDSPGQSMTGSTAGQIGDTETMIADGVVIPTATAETITDPSSTDTWEVSSDPISGSPRSNRYRRFGFSGPPGSKTIPKGAGRTFPVLQNPIAQQHLLGISSLFQEEGPWITIEASHKGTPIQSCGDGIVRFSGFSSLFKCFTIVIEHVYNVVSVYTYCYGPSITVRKGQYVHEKQIIALLDETESNVLMRFSIFDNFNPVDPLNYIKGWKKMRRI